ncbi:helical backbone metal receptor [Alteromonas gracilis]|uniref:helical backbone metal receptor n=1 Tax=Alteromonas gracilis TaxID=1479524 RepID=UPI003735F23D
MPRHLILQLNIALAFAFLCLLLMMISAYSHAQEETKNEVTATLHPTTLSSLNSSGTSRSTSTLKIVSLAPHLTEWAFSLGLGDNLVGVSDYSDFPEKAKDIRRVADFQGADIATIITLEPDLILAWDGGNKPQDIHKLTSMGLNVFSSKVENITDIASEIKRLGALTDTEKQATQLSNHFLNELSVLRREHANPKPSPVFYYSWTSPLMTIGPDAWANQLLNICGAQTLFPDSPVDYPQVALKDVLTRQPRALVAASKSTRAELEVFWREHRSFLKAPLIIVNPDVTSRFSLRLINELKLLCKGIKKNA